jgi:Flp pilus assembly protein TadD
MHLVMYWFFFDRTHERLAKATAAAEAAARLGPDLPDSHVALGWLRYQGFRDYARATEDFEAARRIRPNDDLATFGLASVVRRLGRWEESAALFAEAARLDPRNMRVLHNLAQSLVLSRRYREADDLWTRATSLSPNDIIARAGSIWLQVQWRGDVGRAKTLLTEAERVPGLRDDMSSLRLNAYWLALADRDFAGALRRLDADSRKAYSSQGYFLPVDLLRSEVYGLMGRPDECRRAAEKARIFLEGEIGKNPDDWRLHSSHGIALALLGRDDEALRAARRGVELMPTSKDAWYGLRPIEDLAFVCAMVGRQDEAIERLDILLSSSGGMTPHVLRLDPRWDPLRRNPKFEALLAKYEVRS